MKLRSISKRRFIALFTLLTLMLSGCHTTGDASPSSTTESTVPSDSISAVSDDSSVDDVTMSELEPEPVYEWAFDTPENHGMDGALLESMHTALEATQIYSMVTVRDGVIVDEYYREEYDATSVFPIHSASKSFTGALIGIAIEEGLIEDVDTPISRFFPEINDSDNEFLKQVTIRHLLTHTSGMEWYEWNGNDTTFFAWRDSENWVDYILNRPFTSEPGTVFTYTTGGTHLLAAIVQQVSGMSVMEYATQHIFEPLAIDSAEWLADPQGVADGGNGLMLSARDMAKFGQLYLDDGKWQERQLIPESWVQESTRVQFVRGTNSGDYGYQWWVRPFGAGNYDTYFAMGAWGQFIFVVPELELVTTVTSNHPENTYLPWTYFTDYILAACEA